MNVLLKLNISMTCVNLVAHYVSNYNTHLPAYYV